MSDVVIFGLVGFVAMAAAIVLLSFLVEAMRPIPPTPERLSWAPDIPIRYISAAGSGRAWLHDRRQAPRRALTFRRDEDGRAWWRRADLSSPDRRASSEFSDGATTSQRWPRLVSWR